MAQAIISRKGLIIYHAGLVNLVMNVRLLIARSVSKYYSRFECKVVDTFRDLMRK